jgi:MoxR-like ATPase
MSQENKAYITYNALGKAILLTRPLKDVERWLDSDFGHTGPRRSVVLIDEIDKAPRDFPNDILNEIDNMYFKVPELSNDKIEANSSLWPIVILTSNSEKNLPDAFLRRCVYYNIPFPDDKQMATIVKNRIREYEKQGGGDPAAAAKSADDSNTELLDDALNFFYSLRAKENQLFKKPATAELLGWLTAMLMLGADVDNKLAQMVKDASGRMSNIAELTLSALVKNSDDQKLAYYYLEDYLQQNPA